MNEDEDIDSIEEESVNENTQPNEPINSDEFIKSEDFGQPQETTSPFEPEVELSELTPTPEPTSEPEQKIEPETTKIVEAPISDKEITSEKIAEDSQVKKPVKKHIIKKILLFLLVVILIAAAAAGAYLWRDKEAKAFEQTQANDISSLKSELTQVNKKLVNALAENSATGNLCTTDIECTSIAPNAATIENIKASITSSNLAALEGYMASSVTVALAGSSTVSLVKPTQAISDIAAFTADVTLPWNFSITSTILNSYAEGSFGTYFTDISVVGKSANSKVISISFDCDGKISTVFMASKESLLE